MQVGYWVKRYLVPISLVLQPIVEQLTAWIQSKFDSISFFLLLGQSFYLIFFYYSGVG